MKKRTRRDFGFNTMIRRKSIHMPQHVLARLVGVSEGHLSAIENDRRDPTPDERGKIEAALKEKGA